MSFLKETLVVGPLQCNCTILACEKTLEAVVIDPGDEAENILASLRAKNIKVKYLLHTHAHFDHIGATASLKSKTAAQICLHKGDEEIYKNLPLQGQMFGMKFDAPAPIDKFLEDEEEVTFGEQKLKVIHTPGHSPGGICFTLEGKESLVFSGDTLFQGSIGRTDLWGGDYSQLIRSIKSRLLTLDDSTQVFPGHGPSSVIHAEKKLNPFLS